MAQKNLATVTNELIASYGNTAKNVIQAYRVGNERAAGFVDQRWATVVANNGERLGKTMRGNALAAQKKVTALYVQGVVLTADSAEVAVNRTVELAGKGVEQVAANASRFKKALGVSTLNTLADAAVPAAQAVTKAAAKLEEQSGALVTKLAGKTVKARKVTKAAAPKRPAAKPAVAKRPAVKTVVAKAVVAKAKPARAAKVAKVVKAA
jgi:hypothetical protein